MSKKQVFYFHKTSGKPPKNKVFSILAVSLLIYLVIVILWPLQPINPKTTFDILPTKINHTVVLPPNGSSSLSINGIGVVASNNAEISRPIASITKIITALVVLKEKPLSGNSTGPTITLNAKDNDFYNHYFSLNGSVAPAPVGLEISEFDALNALLLPSANNYADTLVNWAFGTQENFVKNANQFLQENQLDSTQVADASGFSPASKSSATDLLKLGQMVLENPVLSKIVATKSITINGLGEIKNTNFLLNSPEVIGIKTGNTDEAKKCLLFAGKYTLNNQEITIVGTILGQDTHQALFANSQNLLDSASQGLAVTQATQKNQVIANYKTPWGEVANAVASDELLAVTWQNQKPEFNLNIKPYTVNLDNQNAGSLTVNSANKQLTTNLKLSNKINGPSYIWRITHPQIVFGFNK